MLRAVVGVEVYGEYLSMCEVEPMAFIVGSLEGQEARGAEEGVGRAYREA